MAVTPSGFGVVTLYDRASFREIALVRPVALLPIGAHQCSSHVCAGPSPYGSTQRGVASLVKLREEFQKVNQEIDASHERGLTYFFSSPPNR